MRWYAGSEVGERYRRVVAWGGEGDASQPSVGERTLGDMVDPTRPGGVTDIVNVVTRRTGIDAAAWTWERVVSMAAILEHEGQRPPAPP